MKILLRDINNFFQAYDHISQNKLDIKFAWTLHKVKDKLEGDLKFYQDEFTKILLKYSEKDSNGNPVYAEDGQSIKLIQGLENECKDAIANLESMEKDFAREEISVDALPPEMSLSDLDIFSKMLDIK